MIRHTAIAAAVLAITACHAGAEAEERDPGSSVSRDYQVAAFDRIEVSGPYTVAVTTGGAPSAKATGGSNLLDETEVLVEGNVLKIRPRKKNGIRWPWGRKGKAEFAVSTAALRGAQIAGSGGIAVDKVAGDFKGDVAGSGDLRLASVKGGAVELGIAGSGRISAAGTAAMTKVGIAGSGNVDAAGLAVRTADVSIAGSGNVRTQASDSATVDIAGSGNVVVTGGAKCTVSKAGSGNVQCS